MLECVEKVAWGTGSLLRAEVPQKTAVQPVRQHLMPSTAGTSVVCPQQGLVAFADVGDSGTL